MSWIFLLLAGFAEVGWALGLKYTEGFTRPLPTALTIFGLVFSMAFLGLALRDLPMGTAYAVWTGIGTVGTVACGIWLFGDSVTPMRLVCIGLIVAGIVGLKIVS